LLDAVRQIRTDLGSALAGSGLTAGVAGDVATFVDNEKTFNSAFAIVGLATIVLIIGLILLIFRSPVAALLPIFVIGIVYSVTTSLVAAVGKAFDLNVSQDLQTILLIVLFGIGSDYILFLLFRYRERLRAGDDKRTAMIASVTSVGEVIASAAAAVIVAFLVLLLASLGFFGSLGPALAIAVAVMLITSLTLIRRWFVARPVRLLALEGMAASPQGRPHRLNRQMAGGRRWWPVSGWAVVLAAGCSWLADYDSCGVPAGYRVGKGRADRAGFRGRGLAPTEAGLTTTDGPSSPTRRSVARAKALALRALAKRSRRNAVPTGRWRGYTFCSPRTRPPTRRSPSFEGSSATHFMPTPRQVRGPWWAASPPYSPTSTRPTIVTCR
jgi:RND superfamily putative drug exporter